MILILWKAMRFESIMKCNCFSQKRAASLFQRVLFLEAEYLVVDRQTQTGLSNCHIVKTASSTVSIILSGRSNDTGILSIKIKVSLQPTYSI